MAGDLICKEEVYQLVGAAIDVHNQLGCGFLEPVYQEAYSIELNRRQIPFTAQKILPIYYREQKLNKSYVADFLAYEKIIVEIKALEQLSTREESQLINYLKATTLEVGILINFGAEKLEWKRRVMTHPRAPSTNPIH